MASSNNAFTLNGSTKPGLIFSATPSGSGTTPYAKALGSDFSTPPVAPKPTPPPVHTPAPTTQPVASHTTTDAQGNSTTVKYVTPKTDPGSSSSSSGLITNTAAQTQPANTYSGLINMALNNAKTGAADIKTASTLTPQQTQEYNALANLENAKSDTTNRIYANGNMSLDSQQGAAGQITRNLGLQEQALTQGLGLANQSQTQAQTGATSAADLQTNTPLTAAGLAAPIQQPYNSVLTDPQTGLPVNQSGSTGNLNDAVSSIAQKIQNGTMTYDEGTQALNAYGQGGVNALQSALGPNFNISQSNAQGAARATNIQNAGTLNANVESAKAALNSLQTTYDSLSVLQKTPIPGANGLINSASNLTGIGNTATQNYQRVLEDARTQVASALASLGLTTPTDSGAVANAFLPDNMSPSAVKTAIKQIQTLMEQKVTAQATPENASPSGATPGSANSSSVGWF